MRDGAGRDRAERTLGVEEELLLINAGSGVPAAVAAQVLESRQRASDPPDVMLEAELQQQQIETGTDICTTLAEVDRQVRDGRQHAAALAAQSGARLAALATSPLPVDPDTTVNARYQRMAEHFGLTTVEQLTCGCHVHVEIESPAEGVGVLDRIRVWLPVLLALSANSPFWQGRDSGYASFRSQAWSRFPGAGPTSAFGSPAAYTDRVRAMLDSGVILDEHMVYFDARLAERYPTVEVRVADVCLDPADTVLIAGLTRALVSTAAAEWAAGSPAPTVSTDLLRLASWRAGRSGLAGDLLDPATARPRPARQVVGQLLDHVGPALRATGDLDRVSARSAHLLDQGTGADWQRAVYARSGNLRDVVLQAAQPV